MAIPQARISYLIPYGFVNAKAAALIPPDRLVAIADRARDRSSSMLIYNVAWWTDNRDEVLGRWNKFLLG